MTADPLVTNRKAAELLGVSTRTLARYVASGQLDRVKLSPAPQGRVRIPAAALEAFIAARRG